MSEALALGMILKHQPARWSVQPPRVLLPGQSPADPALTSHQVPVTSKSISSSDILRNILGHAVAHIYLMMTRKVRTTIHGERPMIAKQTDDLTTSKYKTPADSLDVVQQGTLAIHKTHAMSPPGPPHTQHPQDSPQTLQRLSCLP